MDTLRYLSHVIGPRLTGSRQMKRANEWTRDELTRFGPHLPSWGPFGLGGLGYLDPPPSPRDRRPRLESAFGVNAERWLIATVRDLLAQPALMSETPVVRLV